MTLDTCSLEQLEREMSGDKKCGFLVLEDGSRYKGTVFGGTQSVPGEVGELDEGFTPISSRLHNNIPRLTGVRAESNICHL